MVCMQSRAAGIIYYIVFLIKLLRIDKDTYGETLRAQGVGLGHFLHITVTHYIIQEEDFRQECPL